MNSIPNDSIYDATTESFVDASNYTDASGNLIAPAGYSFVTAEVSASSTPHANQFMTPTFRSPSLGGLGAMTPSFGLNTPAGMYNMGANTPMHNYGGGRPYYGNNYRPQMNRPRPPRINFKAHLVEHTYDAIKSVMTAQGLWVDVRQEDEGYYTIRIHAKKQSDVAIAPAIIQKIASEVGIIEFSMHYLTRPNIRSEKKSGLTIYIRLHKSEENVRRAIAEFATHKIHARRVRNPDLPNPVVNAPLRKLPTKPKPPTKSKAKRSYKPSKSKSKSLMLVKKEDAPPKPLRPSDIVPPKAISPRKTTPSRVFPDEDPDLESEDEDNLFGIIQPKKTRSKTISVLVPNREASDVVELKFENGARTKINVRQCSSKSKSVSRINAERALRPPTSAKITQSWGSI